MIKKSSILLMLIVFAIGLWAGFQQMRPPSPPSESDADYPTYQRMLANLKAMTAVPHPAGSKELDEVRTYLLAQIDDMGLKATVDREIYTAADMEAEHLAEDGPPIQKRVDRKPPSGTEPSNKPIEVRMEENGETPEEMADLNLSNIWVKLDAPGTDRGVLMLAHYDSENKAPGTADDMVSVCALLEALRKEAGNSGLQRDLYFLFTDGEEESALGAKAFVKSHPELKNQIDVVLNFDARGDRGGLLMFETSAPNYDLVRHFQSASSRPLAYSFLTGLYRKMPNGTDLTSFLKAGYSGLNFAVAEGVEHYHQPSDNFANLNRGTAYNFLQTALEMADYGGKGKFQDKSSKRDSVFFTLLPGHLVAMNDFTAYFLSAVAMAASILWIVIQIRLRKVNLCSMIKGTGWLAAAMAGIGLLSWGIVSLLTRMMHLSSTTNNDTVFLWTALGHGLGALAVTILRMRKQSLAEAVAGLLPIQVLLTVGTAIFFYEISYIFTLSTLGILVVAFLDRYPLGRTIAGIVLGVGVWLLYVPICWIIYVMFMMPLTPVAIALSVLPLSIVAAFFAASSRVSVVPAIGQIDTLPQ